MKAFSDVQMTFNHHTVKTFKIMEYFPRVFLEIFVYISFSLCSSPLFFKSGKAQSRIEHNFIAVFSIGSFSSVPPPPAPEPAPSRLGRQDPWLQRLRGEKDCRKTEGLKGIKWKLKLCVPYFQLNLFAHIQRCVSAEEKERKAYMFWSEANKHQ